MFYTTPLHKEFVLKFNVQCSVPTSQGEHEHGWDNAGVVVEVGKQELEVGLGRQELGVEVHQQELRVEVEQQALGVPLEAWQVAHPVAPCPDQKGQVQIGHLPICGAVEGQVRDRPIVWMGHSV